MKYLFVIKYELDTAWGQVYMYSSKLYSINIFNYLDVGRLRFELRTSRLKAGCSTAELATHFVKSSTYEIIPF